jgi:hypothetical protein
MQVSQQVYEDTQHQSPQPIWPQESLPVGIHNIEFSWDRFCRIDGGYMRIIFRDLADDPDAKVAHPHHGYVKDGKQYGGLVHPYTWWLKEYLGKAQILGTDNEEGRIYMRAMAELGGETLYMWRDPDALPHKIAEGVKREKTHNRLCYRRSSRDWRLRDEHMGNHPNALVFTRSYIGDLEAEKDKNDSVAHIYHNGYVIIDKDDVAHLYDTEL